MFGLFKGHTATDTRAETPEEKKPEAEKASTKKEPPAPLPTSTKTERLAAWVQTRRDRTLRARLVQDKGVKLAQKKLEEQTNGYGLWGRRRLLTGAMRVRRGMVPKLDRAFDHCKEVLGFQSPVELYVRADADYGAFMMKSPTGPLALGVTSRTIEGFSDAELRHVIGHELAHAVFDHSALPMPLTALIEDMAGAIVDRPQQLELFLWCRAAELSVDRAGLVCAGDVDAGIRAFLKLSSGLPSDLFGHFDHDAYIAQAASIASAPVARLKPRDDDDSVEAFSTHPYSPLRVKAMIAYAKSDAFFQMLGLPVPAGALAIDDVEDIVERDLELMEASYLEEKGELADKMRRVLFLSGYVTATADVDDAGAVGEDVLGEKKRKALVALLGTEVFWPAPDRKKFTVELDEKLPEIKEKTTRIWRTQLMQHLTVVAAADGHVSDAARAAMTQIAQKLDVDAGVVDATLATAAAPFV
jgi:hypothetical protein